MHKRFYRTQIRNLKVDILSGRYFRQLPDTMKSSGFRQFIKNGFGRRGFLECYRKERNIHRVLGSLLHATALYCSPLSLRGRPMNAIKIKPTPSLADLAKQIGLDHVPTWEEIRDKVESPDADGSNIALIELYRILKPVSPIH